MLIFNTFLKRFVLLTVYRRLWVDNQDFITDEVVVVKDEIDDWGFKDGSVVTFAVFLIRFLHQTTTCRG